MGTRSALAMRTVASDPPLVGGVGDPAGVHAQPVVPARRQHLRMADRDAGHMLDGDGLLVVGEQVGGHPADAAQRGVHRGDHRGQRLVQDRQHHPVARPGQPGAEQLGWHARHRRAVAEVVLHPHPRLGQPRPVHPGPPGPPVGPHLGHRPPGRARRPLIAQVDQLAVGDVGAQPAPGALHPLLQLGQERVDEHRPAHRLRGQPALLAGRDVAGHRVMGAVGQFAGVA